MNARSILVAALAALASLASLAACAAQQAGVRNPPARAAPAPALPPAPIANTPAEPAGIPDRELGLARGSVFEVLAPPAVVAEGSSPGELPLPPRAYPGAPPVIPHTVGDLLPITRTQNVCLDCHQLPGAKVAGEPTPIPATHYVDLRRAPEKLGKRVAGARFVCTACHVSRTDQAPLVPY